MSLIGKVAQNTGIIMAANAVVSFLGMLATVFTVRYLGVDRFGALSFVLTYVAFFAIIAELVTTQIIVREISRDRSTGPALAGNAILIKIILSFTAIAISCVAISLFRQPFDMKILAYIASLSFLGSFSAVYISIFRSRLEMAYPMAVEVLTSALKLGTVLYLVYVKASLAWFVAAMVLSAVPGVIINMLLSRRLIKPVFRIDLAIWKRLIIESWPVVLSAVFITIYLRIDQLMLFKMKGPEEVGYYAAAVKLTEIFGAIPSAFVMSVFPAFSEYFMTSSERLEKAYRASFKCMATIIMPIAFGLFIIAGPAAGIVYGESFARSAAPLKILIWSDIFIFLGMVHSNLLVAAGLQKLDFLFAVINAAVNVTLNLILIPRYGMSGAATASLISYGSWIPMAYFLKKTRAYTKAMLLSALRPLAAAVMMGGCVYILFSMKMPLVAVISAGIITYMVCIIIVKGIKLSDLEYLKRASTGKAAFLP